MKRKPDAADLSWQEHAACVGEDPELFVPDKTGTAGAADVEKAKAICRGCGVREECLAFAIHNRESYGTWGGLHGRELRRVTGGTLGRRAS